MKEIQALKSDLSAIIFHSNVLQGKVLPKLTAFLITLISCLQSLMLSGQGYQIILKLTNVKLNPAIIGLYNYLLAVVDISVEEFTRLDFIIFLGVGIYLFFFVITIFIGGFSFYHTVSVPSSISKYFISWNYIHTFLLFTPINEVIFNLLIQTGSTLEQRPWAINMCIMVGCILGLISNVGISMMLLLMTIIIKTKDPFSRIDNRFIVSSLVQKFTLPMIYWFGENKADPEEIAWLFNIANLLVLLYQAFVFLDTPPFYYRKMNIVIYYTSILSLTIAILNLVSLGSITEDSRISFGNILTIVMLISPFVMKTYEILISDRREIIFKSEQDYRDRQTDLANHFRKMKKLLQFLDVRKFPKNFFFKEFQEVALRLKYKECTIHSNEKELGIYLAAMISKMHPSPLIILTAADLLIKNCKNIPKSYLICQKLLTQSHTAYSERLTARALIGSIQDYLMSNQSENDELLKFMESVNNHDELGNLIQKTVHEREIFYNLIIGENPNLEAVCSSSKKIQNWQNKISVLWEGLSRQNINDYPPLLKMYAYFKIFVEIQIETGKDIMRQYNKIMARKIVKPDDSVTKNLFATDNTFIVIGLEQNNFGKVVSCTLNVKKIFGIPAKDLMGKNIGHLIPQTIANAHDSIIRNALDSSERIMKLTKIESLALHKKGHIFPIEMAVTLFPSLDDGLSYWGMVKKLVNQFEYIILNEKGIIEGMSYYLKESLKIPLGPKSLASTYFRITINRPDTTYRFDTSRFSKYDLKNRGNISTRFITQDEENESIIFGEEQNNPNFVNIDELKAFHISFFDSVIESERPRNFDVKCEKRVYNSKKVYYLTLKKYSDFQTFTEKKSPQRLNIVKSVRSEKIETLEAEDVEEGVLNIESNRYFFKHEDIIETERPVLASPNNLRIIKRESTKSRNFYAQSQDQIESTDKDEDDHDDEPEISDFSDKQMDDKASMMSISSSKAELELQKSLTGIIVKSKYFNFRESYVLIAFLVLFLISFIVSILIMYFNASSSTIEVEDRIRAVDHLSLRGQQLAIMLVDLYPIWLFDRVFLRPLDPRALFYVKVVVPFYEKMIQENSYLKDAVVKLSEEEKLFFFAEDLKMYTDDFSNIPNTNKFQYVNSFTLANALYSQAMHYTNNYNETTLDSRKYALNFIFANIINDLWEKTLKGPQVLTDAMQKKVNSIESLNDGFFALSMSTLGLLFISLIVVLLKSYFDTDLFLTTIIRAGNSVEITQALNNLMFFKSFLSQKLQGSDFDNNNQRKKNSKRSSNSRLKKSHIISKTLLRLGFLVTLLVIPFILIFRSYTLLKDSSSNIMPVLNDINKMNHILYKAMPVQSYLGLLFIRPTTIVENKRVGLVIEQALKDFRNSVSYSNDFLPQTWDLLNQDVCPYYQVNEVYMNCTQLFRGFGKKGVINTVIAMATYQMEYRKLILATPITPANIIFLVYQYENIEATYLMAFGVSLAIANYQRRIVDSLIANLNSSSQGTIVLVAPAVIFGFIIALSIAIIIYKVIRGERKIISNTMLILPLDLIMNNKGLKQYMMRESKHFYKLIKRYEYVKKKEKNLIQKMKHEE